MTPAEERAQREGLPVIRLLPHDCLSIMQGHPMICATVDDNEVLVRLYTADEFMAAHRKGCQKYGVEPSLSTARAEELTRPLGGAS